MGTGSETRVRPERFWENEMRGRTRESETRVRVRVRVSARFKLMDRSHFKSVILITDLKNSLFKSVLLITKVF